MTTTDPVKRLQAKIAELHELAEELTGLKAHSVDSARVGDSRPNRPKLTDREVADIRTIKRSGLSNQAIADIYDVNKSTISRILKGVYHR